MSHKRRNEIQTEARVTWKLAGAKGLLAMATGTGKSKIAVDEAKEQHKLKKKKFKALLVVPTEKLRDVNWKKEFVKWKAEKTWDIIQRECYASLAKIQGDYDLVILDEAHYITEANSIFFKKNKVKSILALTATPPKDITKQLILKKIAPTIYKYTLEQAVEDGLVAPFNIIVIEAPLNKVDRNILSGSKAKPFMQTEEAKYEYLCKKVVNLQYAQVSADVKKWAYLNRMRFIYNLPSKTALAKKVIATKLKGRYLVFGGGINQIEELMAPDVYHSKSTDKYYNSFMAEKTNTLGAVRALKEGHDIPNLDMILVVQLTAQELDIIQQIGRVVRWRKGHVATVYILIASGTKDEDWLESALQGFDQSKITFKKAYQL